MARLSIIMPVLDEGEQIAAALDALSPLRALGVEVIVVDGGSHDATIQRARLRADHVLKSPRGRALQMNAGAEIAVGDVLLFLHADTRLARANRVWGRFDVTIDGGSSLLALVARFMNMRSRLTGIATGDQAMFVQRKVFRNVGGFPPIDLMEDVALSKRLKREGRPLALRERVVTSGRRWQTYGVLPTILLMSRLRLAYFFGADPAALAKRYGHGG
jgi:rSAM/selenodomain-associated transferase 2